MTQKIIFAPEKSRVVLVLLAMSFKHVLTDAF